jgi:CBS domain-containing protein
VIPSARDLMERHVISVSPSAPLLDVQRLFAEEGIGGAPVVDEMSTLIGVITSSDLLRAIEEEHDTVAAQADYFRDLLPYSSPDWSSSSEDFQDRLAERRVEEVMTTRVLTVGPEATAAEVAHDLRTHQVHRLFVVQDGRLIGIISTFDLLRVVEDLKGA